jgi:hypothetical protein
MEDLGFSQLWRAGIVVGVVLTLSALVIAAVVGKLVADHVQVIWH